MFEGVLGIKKPIFGLDIGHETLKIAQVKGTGTNARLFSINEVPIPPDSLTKEGIKNEDKIIEAIIKATKNAKPKPISAKIVSSALPESLVFTKIIELPKMKYSEIEKNIPYQINEFFPIPIEETYFDWQVIGDGSKPNTCEIFVVAASKVIIDSLTNIVKKAGFELLGLETKPIALVRALANVDEQGPYLVMDIGAKATGMTIYDQSNIKLTSTVTMGAKDIEADPDSLKILSGEITHLIKYYQNRLGRAQVFKRVILAGGGANNEATEKVLQDLTKIKTEIGLPRLPIKNFDPRFTTVIGMAMKDI